MSVIEIYYSVSELLCSLQDQLGNRYVWDHIAASLCNIANFTIYATLCNRFAKVFGKGAAFPVGLIVFNSIFIMILGLGSSQYLGTTGRAAHA